MFKKKSEINHLVYSLFLASSILIFHVVLLAGLGILVLFFRGIVNYILWIFVGGCALIMGSAYLFIKYMQKEGGRKVQKILTLPEFQGRSVEVSVLGGLASFKIGRDDEKQPGIESNFIPVSHQLEGPQSIRLRELTEFARLLEKDLITLDEYYRVKKTLLDK
jgi:hypothetical protein